ncbi:hypothetical protein ACIQ9Q_43300 [Streptomyces sp. NPDC094438]|uniref:hypothetical protein n=1 Tax=Streptomyces sp. NPDC094438 TaxID=3366061 RepID=UPI0037F72D1E
MTTLHTPEHTLFDDEPATEYPTGLREKLMAAVRPEFRSAVLVVAPDDPVFGSSPCLVGPCERAARLHGMCIAHHQRWDAEGRPDTTEFAAHTASQIRGDGTMMSCAVAGCGYGRTGHGLCITHVRQWHLADRPDISAWLPTCPTVTTPAPHGQCRVKSCELWATARIPFCVSHAQRWRKAGRPDVAEFAVAHEQTPHHGETIDLLVLPARLRLEIQTSSHLASLG